MVYGSETWGLKGEDLKLMERAEMRMLRWMLGIWRLEKRSNDEVRAIAGVEPIEGVLMRRRLSWYGHVERRGKMMVCGARGIW